MQTLVIKRSNFIKFYKNYITRIALLLHGGQAVTYKTFYRPLIICLLLLLSFNPAIAQDQTQEEIVSEGMKLYRAELTSWNGTDLFSMNYPEKSDEVGGNFSYEDSSGLKCVFFSKA